MADKITADKPTDPAAKKARDRVIYWLDQITAARKREKDWRKEGKRVLQIYNGQKKEQIPFNILYSNTETLSPALYNATPRSLVQRRFKDDDPLGKASATAGQRTLEFLMDTNGEEYASFDDVISDAVLDALLPGRGVSRVRYDADVVGAAPNRYLKSELVCYESVKWDRCVFGYAKKWRRVPWFAFEYDMTQEEATELFGKAKADQLQFTADEKATSDDADDQDKDKETDEDRKIAKVWEVWVRDGKKVIFVSPNSPGVLLKEEEDPLGLTGFFPVPEPLRFLRKSNDLMPTALYNLYENQAKELNRLSIRINRVAEAIKVRGAYDSTITELDQLLKQDDNAMVGAQNVAALTEKGLEGAIWLMPIDKLIAVLQQLYLARQACKQVIYEITGISDILRGASVASETATAQNLKAQWGSLRLKRMQREVQKYAREMLRITLEIAGKRFQEQTFAKMTGLPYATTKELQAAQGQIAGARAQISMTAPQVTQDPKALEAAIAQLVPVATQTLSKPAWGEVVKLLRDDTLRQYRIDIETNSTVDVEAVEDQKQMSEVLGAVSQFIQGVAPLVTTGAMPFQVAQSMLLAVVRRYRMGTEIEDSIKQMQPPKNPDEGKAQAEQQKAAAEQTRAQEQHQMDMDKTKLELQARQRELEMEAEFKKREHELKMAEMAGKLEVARIMSKIKLQEAENKLAVTQAQGEQQLRHGAQMAEQKEAAAKAEAERKSKEKPNAPA